MGDVSVFMREFKTRFTFWYNEKNTARWALSGRSVSAVWWWRRIPKRRGWWVPGAVVAVKGQGVWQKSGLSANAG